MLRVTLPPWVAHLDEKQTRTPIYTVDVHPRRKVMATGGLDTKIRIWDLSVVVEEVEDERDCEAEMDIADDGTSASRHKLLATLALHNGAVLCVRFSNEPTRTRLASSSDGDNVVMIWEQDSPDSSSSLAYRGTVFGSGETNHESWRCVRRLAGHQLDVVDLAWSPSGEYLATCGLDGCVMVWETEGFERIRRLDAHHGFVKGLAWDPAGKFLASQSDDRSVIIWNTADWSVFKQVFSRFEKPIGGETFFKRLSWSPDGSQVCAVHAVDQSQLISTATVINRENWTEDACLVGHKSVIACASYNPHVFTRSRDGDAEDATSSEPPYTVCAVGDQDGAVSIWLSSNSRPPLVITSLFHKAVNDIRWSADGLTAVASSADGTVAVLQFDDGVLGVPVVRGDVEAMMAKYGFHRRMEREKLIAEFPEQMRLEETFRLQQREEAAKHVVDGDALMEVAVAPVHAGAVPDRLSSLMAGANGFQVAASGSVSLSQIPVSTSATQPPSTPAPAANSDIRRVQPVLLTSTPHATVAQVAPAPTAAQQKISLTKDGRRRVQPVFIQSPAIDRTNTLLAASGATPHGTTATGKRAADIDSNLLREEIAIKRRIVELLRDKEGMRVDEHVVKVPVPKVRAKFTSVVARGCHVTVENPVTAGQVTAKINCHVDGTLLWTDIISKPVLQLTASPTILALATTDNTLFTYHMSTGRRLLPRLRLDGRAAHMTLEGGALALLTDQGRVWSWVLEDGSADGVPQCAVRGVSIAALFPAPAPAEDDCDNGEDGDNATDVPAPSVAALHVKPTGQPLIALSDRSIHAYDQRLRTWACAFSGDHIDVQAESFDWSSADHLLLHSEDSSVAGLLGGIAREGRWNPAMVLHQFQHANLSKDLQQRISVSHLEDQLAVAQTLRDADLYRRVMRVYACKIGDIGDVGKAELLCRGLREGVIARRLDVDGRELLREVLPYLAQNRRFQRLVRAYQEEVVVRGEGGSSDPLQAAFAL